MNAQRQAAVGRQVLGLWCAFIFSVLIGIGWLGVAHFWMPAPADLGAEATKQFYTVTYRSGMLLGNSILTVACAFLVPGSVQMGLTLAELEGRQPLWSICTAVSGCFISLIVFLNAGFWIGAAYRPDAGADLVVALNDVAWMGFLLGWVFLSLQMNSTAIVALSDKSALPMIPHWLSKLSIAGAAVLVCAGGPAFFQSGPFAYHGLLGFYVPMVIWGLWLDVHVWFMRRHLLRSLAEPAAAQVLSVANAIQR
jgi:hypothetical protein